MTRRVLIKCQQCGKEAVVTVTEELDKVTAEKALEYMPRDWRPVYLDLGGTNGLSIGDVCSLKCGVTWARDKIIEAIQAAERVGQYIDED